MSMEAAFAGDRQEVVVFPDNLTPFPETGDLLSPPAPAPAIHSPQIQHHFQNPPQKLRPIRCNGRNYSDHAYLQNGTLVSCYSDPSSELGFLTHLSAQKLSVVNEDCSPTPPYIGSAALPGSGDAFSGNICSLVDTSALHQIKSEMDAECMNLISEGRLLVDELSPSSDDGSESSEANKVPLNRKRKRKTIELFLESMTNKVMQKQEQMHKQLIEMLEEKEKERIGREEAWRQQEIERAKRDEEARAQEASRSLALISFIQKLSGHEIQIPKASETSFLEKDEGEIHNQEEFKCDSSNRRWPKSEVQALITVRTALDQKFLNGPKGSVWEEVAVGLSNMGYCRTAKKCKEKWENINKYYKRTMESGKKRPDNSKSCPYFHELDILYKNGLIASGNAFNCIKNENDDCVNE